jgi:lipoate-protein ligase A
MRFVDLGVVTPEYSVSADRFFLRSHSSADDDTLIVYSRDRPCISVGRYQNFNETINVGYAKEKGISVVRRVSGGSNIYSDTEQMTYSLIVSKDRLPDTKEGSFAVICGCLVRALAMLGIKGEHKPINDVLVNGKKISGAAQARSRSAVLQHGTIILDVNEDVVSSSLKDVKQRSYDGLTSMKECLGVIPSRSVITNAVMNGFAEVFGPLTASELSADEDREIKGSIDLLLI